MEATKPSIGDLFSSLTTAEGEKRSKYRLFLHRITTEVYQLFEIKRVEINQNLIRENKNVRLTSIEFSSTDIERNAQITANVGLKTTIDHNKVKMLFTFSFEIYPSGWIKMGSNVIDASQITSAELAEAIHEKFRSEFEGFVKGEASKHFAKP